MATARAATAAHAGAPVWGAPASTFPEAFKEVKPAGHLSNEDDDAGQITTDDVMRLNTGWQLSPEHWRESAQRRQVLAEQTARMADALEQFGGIRARASVRLVAIGNSTGEIDEEESYRPIRFLPLIAQRERRPILNALRYYQRNDPSGAHLRYAVITAGPRVLAWGDLRGTQTRLQRQVSRWSHDADRDWDIEVVYRGTEFTRDEAATYHLHANVLYRPRRGQTHPPAVR